MQTQFDVKKQLEMSNYVGQRIHYTQMSNETIGKIMKRLKGVKKWSINGHTFDRINQKGIKATANDLISVISNCSIIEYKIDYNSKQNRCEERVVVRANTLVNRNYNLNVVYNISSGVIITVWINHINDRHSTLNWDIYNKNMKVFA